MAALLVWQSPPGEVASEPVAELALPAAAGLMSAAQAAVRLSGGDCGTMIWTTKVKGALLCLRPPHSTCLDQGHCSALPRLQSKSFWVID